jgi:hypothetical protein
VCVYKEKGVLQCACRKGREGCMGGMRWREGYGEKRGEKQTKARKDIRRGQKREERERGERGERVPFHDSLGIREVGKVREGGE